MRDRDVKDFMVGDRIRSYDFEPFPGRPDRYVEGVITEIDEMHLIHIKVDVDTAFPNNPRPEVYTGLNLAFSDYEGRLTKLEDV